MALNGARVTHPVGSWDEVNDLFRSPAGQGQRLTGHRSFNRSKSSPTPSTNSSAATWPGATPKAPLVLFIKRGDATRIIDGAAGVMRGHRAYRAAHLAPYPHERQDFQFVSLLDDQRRIQVALLPIVIATASGGARPLAGLQFRPATVGDQMSSMSSEHIPGLLDQWPISGPVAIYRYLSPGRSAWIVNQDSYADALAAVSGMCAQWGGGADLLIPAMPRASLSPMWEDFLYANAVDATATRDVVPNDNLSAAAGAVTSQTSGALLVAVLARRSDRDNWAACFDPSTVPVDNPWHLAYVACQGLLPPDPTEEELRFQRIVPDTTIRDILEIDSVAPDQPGAADLLDRVYRRRTIGPVVVTMSEWPAYPPPEGSTFHSEPPMPIRYGRATRFNGNIVVVYTPGDVGDLCTAWDLRAIYGHPRWAPLTVPATEDVVGVVAAWMRENAFTGTGLRPVEVALVSHSVPIEQLEGLAAGLGHEDPIRPLGIDTVAVLT